MWKKLFEYFKAWISKPENQEKVKEAVEKGAEIIQDKIKK